MEENYSERYERLKKLGVTVPIQFIPQMITQEEFKPITDHAIEGIDYGRYAVSNHGRVYDNYRDKYIEHLNKNGYYSVGLSTRYGYKTIGVHRLVMLVFDYNHNYQNLQVNHIDANPSNNNLANLEWTTPKENTDHAMLYGLHKMNGTDNPNNKLTEEQVKEICELIQSGKYHDTEIAKMYNISYATVTDIHNGNIWVKVSSKYDLSYKKPIKLTEKEVREICKMLETGNYFTTEIARKFNTTHRTVIDIRDGKTWTNISKDYNIITKKKARKFTDDQIREICELIQSGKYYDREIAKMYNTSGFMIGSLRRGVIHKEITKDYDLTVRKPQIRKVPLYRGDIQIN